MRVIAIGNREFEIILPRKEQKWEIDVELTKQQYY